MPGYLHHPAETTPLNRRGFIKAAAGTVGALSLTGCYRWAHTSQEDNAFHVALLSDPHIPEDPSDGYNGFSPIDNLNLVIPNVVAARPAAALISGDAARLVGTEADYQTLKQMLAPMASAMPVFIGLGNHDDRDNFYAVFENAGEQPGAQPVMGKHVVVLESQPVRLILLDSLREVNEGGGELGPEQRAWLEQYLDTHDSRPTALFLHHTLGDGGGDLADTEALFEIIATRPQVKALFFGHSHRYGLSVRDGVHLINLPAIGYNFGPEPLGWADAYFHRTGVRYTLDVVAGTKDEHGKEVSLSWLR